MPSIFPEVKFSAAATFTFRIYSNRLTQLSASKGSDMNILFFNLSLSSPQQKPCFPPQLKTRFSDTIINLSLTIPSGFLGYTWFGAHVGGFTAGITASVIEFQPLNTTCKHIPPCSTCKRIYKPKNIFRTLDFGRLSSAFLGTGRNNYFCSFRIHVTSFCLQDNSIAGSRLRIPKASNKLTS